MAKVARLLLASLGALLVVLGGIAYASPTMAVPSGASARSASAAHTTYDRPAQPLNRVLVPAGAARATPTTQRNVQAIDVDLTSLQLAGVAAKTERRVVNGETTATKYGREMHATWDYGPGFQREFRLPSGRRVDGINLQTRQIVELKPNNPRAIRLGERQLDDYLTELNDAYPGSTPWTGSIQTYTRP